MKTRKELLEVIEQFHEDTGLKAIPMNVLAAWCQSLGQSGRGSKNELIKRLLSQLRG